MTYYTANFLLRDWRRQIIIGAKFVQGDRMSGPLNILDPNSLSISFHIVNKFEKIAPFIAYRSS
jgi:hypothetical protein